MSLRRPTPDGSPVVPGVAASVATQIRRVEVSQLCAGAVARALADWTAVVRRPGGLSAVTRAQRQYGCPCCDPTEPRNTLQVALAALSPPSRRALLRLIEPLDAHFERRTVPDPNAPAHLPWWSSRC